MKRISRLIRVALTTAATGLTLFAAIAGGGSAQSSLYRFGLEITIGPVEDQPHAFECTATFRDLASGQVVAAPKALSTWGESAQITQASADDKTTGLRFDLTVLVDSSGHTATYTAEVRRSEQVLASHKGTVRVS